MSQRISLTLGIILLITLACGLQGQTSNDSGQEVSQTYYPSISANPLGGPPGTTHTIYFDGFPPNAELSVKIESSETGGILDTFSVTVNAQGSALTYVTTPQNASFGSHFITASGQGFNSPASGQFIVAPADTGQLPDQKEDTAPLPPPQQSPGTPVVIAQPASGQPGTHHDLFVSGFPANALLTVEFFDPNLNLLASFNLATDGTGNGQTWIETASDAAPGTYIVDVTGPGNRYGTASILITSKTSAQPAPPNQANQVDEAEFDAVMNALVTNLQVYWSLNFNQVWPEYASQYGDIEVYSYTAPAVLPGCNKPPEETYDNAFYCYSVDTVYFDENWFRNNYAKYGVLFPAYLIAHEWGHAAQDVIGLPSSLSLEIEAQADCFTGAYFAWGEEKGYYSLEDISTISYTIIPNELAESHWTWYGKESHGGALRIGFFGKGYANGIDFCKNFP